MKAKDTAGLAILHLNLNLLRLVNPVDPSPIEILEVDQLIG